MKTNLLKIWREVRAIKFAGPIPLHAHTSLKGLQAAREMILNQDKFQDKQFIYSCYKIEIWIFLNIMDIVKAKEWYELGTLIKLLEPKEPIIKNLTREQVLAGMNKIRTKEEREHEKIMKEVILDLVQIFLHNNLSKKRKHKKDDEINNNTFIINFNNKPVNMPLHVV